MNETIPINMVNHHKLSQYLNYKSLQVNDFKACYPNLQLQQGPILKYSVAAPPQKDCKSISLKTYFERETYIILKHTVTIHMSLLIIQYISSIIIEDEVLFELEARARWLQILGSFSNFLLLLMSIVVKM